jgi:Helix-turn-helix domain/RodZ C-terminal domain
MPRRHERKTRTERPEAGGPGDGIDEPVGTSNGAGAPPRTTRVGSRLRAARRRRGLELADVERDLHIRSRHLHALEQERFDELPGEAYARAFVREYADYLGLDADLVVRALGARLAAADQADEWRGDPKPVPSGGGSVWIVAEHVAQRLPGRRALAIAAALAIVLLALFAWPFESRDEAPTVAGSSDLGSGTVGSGRALVAHPVPPARARRAATTSKRHVQPSLARLVLSTASGDCWLFVRSGDENGPVLYEGILQPGRVLRFARKQLWIRMGAPWNLEARLNGRRVTGLPAWPANVVVTPGGLRPA